ncbi:sensor histidine kinase [Paenibacillus sp. P96]|uniref:Sensor histidine kinase n=1 Tax=Paenibacillus zeirhizosphaerae TaxID=2987519 RepID=A0ABT9FX86_9BACL|nr:sensor histidine kinase [Paenibacillus sp. P96]MDP4099338.1 sensor histidine kinase [Paenibacillus sp. P96]
MKKYLDRMKQDGLFIKLFIVMIISITAVSVLTSLVTIRMSERLFVETFSITNSKVLNQIKTSFESFNDSIVNASSHASQSLTVKSFLTAGSTDSVTTARAYFTMGQQMKQIKSSVDAYDVRITIAGVNGRSYSNGQAYWPLAAEDLADHPITVNTMAEPKRLMYQYDRQRGPGAARDEHFIIASKALVERTSGSLYGLLYVSIREQEFKQFYANFTSSGNDVVILDKTGRIVSSNREELIGQSSPGLLSNAEDLVKHQLPYKNADVMGKDHILLANYIPAYDFYLVNLIDRRYAVGQIIDVKSVMMICLVIISLALLIVFLISRRLTNSLSRLVKQMSKITEKNFDNYINITGSYETRELGKAYNYMLYELNDYIEKLLHTQKEQRNAELAALQRQINPHFLYNTLASVKFLVQQGSKEKAADTINALISLLQNTISNVSETITIEQELANMRNYVFINHIRYGDRIKVNMFAAPDCMHYHVPKLIIQPFIENAFFHAFNHKNEGTIYILVSHTEDTLICEVADNGDGMDGLSGQDTLPNPKSKRQLFTGIGIQNVHNRITLLYGEQYGVSITSAKGEGTKVTITLPLIEQLPDSEE